MALTFACDPIVGVVAHRSSSGVAHRISQYVKRCGPTRREQASEAQSSSWPSAGPPHVVVVGGGFGGLYAARALARHPVRITLLDQQNYHLFQPLLYQVATAALSAGDIAKPIRSIVRRNTRMRVLLAEAQSVNLSERTLQLANGSALAYDYLVLATGASHTYFGHPEWEPFAPGLKTLEDALEIRRRVLLALEAAEQEEDVSERRALLTFVIVGGGPTGVELAGAIAEITRHTVRYDFRAADPSQARVILLDAGARILPSYPADLSARAEEQLWGLGVEVRKNAAVTLVTARGVHVGDEVIATRTALWAAGVRASPLGLQLGTPLDPSGRVLVDPNLTVPGHAEVYVVGDLAAFTHQQRNGNTATRRRTRGDSDGRTCGREHLEGGAGPAGRGVPLRGPREHGDNRSGRRHRSDPLGPPLGSAGLAGLVVRPHLLSDRIREPCARARSMDMVVLHVPTRRKADYAHGSQHPMGRPRSGVGERDLPTLHRD
jgi:NADH dehydrogenase FAD-containing subunit